MMDVVGPLGRIGMGRVQLQVVHDVNALHHQDAVFNFNLSGHVAGQLVIASGDLTRLQRASKGAG